MPDSDQTAVASQTGSATAQQAGSIPPERRRRPTAVRVLVFALAAMLVAGVAILADGYYQAYRIYREARGVLPLIQEAKASLARGTMPPGDPLGRAAAIARATSNDLAHARFTLQLVGGLPLLGRPVRAVRLGVAALAEDGQAAAIGQNLVNELLPPAGPSGSQTALQSKIFQNGAVNVALIQTAIPQVGRMLTHLQNGERYLKQIPSLPFVGGLKASGLKQSGEAVHLVERALAGLRVIPGFLGADSPKTYFLALENSADQRGTGGAVLAYALVRIDRGKPSFISGGPISNIDNAAHGVSVPLPRAVSWYLRAARTRPRINNGINYTPDFPVVAKTWAAQVKRVTGTRVDGVIALTPAAIGAALKSALPIRIPSYPVPIDGNNVASLVESRQYILPTAQQRALPGELIGSAFHAITHPASGLAMARELAIALTQKDMQMWSPDPNVQKAIVAEGWDGGLRPYAGDYLYLVDEKRITNKVDYFSHPAVNDTVVVGASGAIRSTCRVTLANNTPRFLPTAVTGRLAPYAVNVAMMNLYVPSGAKVLSVSGANSWLSAGITPAAEVAHIRPVGFVQHLEGAYRVLTSIIAAWPGHIGSVTYTYSVPGAIRNTAQGHVYQLTLQHQPLAHPEEVLVRVVLPTGTKVRRVDPGWTVSGRVATFHARLTRDLVTQILY